MNEEQEQLYGYFLPTNADVDEAAVREALVSHYGGRVSFLDLGTGDVVSIDLPRDQELYDGMKREVFAYAEIPQLTGGSGMSLDTAFREFLAGLPVTVERDLALLCGPECDCEFCSFERFRDGANEDMVQ